MSWLTSQIQTVTQHGGGILNNLDDTTTMNRTGGPTVQETRTPSLLTTTQHGAKTTNRTTTPGPQETNGSDSKTTQQQVVEDAGFHVQLKVKIRSGLTSNTSNRPLCS
jgi:hypothetical protein